MSSIDWSEVCRGIAANTERARQQKYGRARRDAELMAQCRRRPPEGPDLDAQAARVAMDFQHGERVKHEDPALYERLMQRHLENVMRTQRERAGSAPHVARC